MVIAPLIALLVVLGFYPKPLLDVINPSVKQTLVRVDQDRTRSRPSPEKGAGRDVDLAAREIRPHIEYGRLAPILIVFGAAVVGVLVEAFAPRDQR